MKKILWLCNTMLPELSQRFHTCNMKEGWLAGISGELRKRDDIEFHYVCPQTVEKRIVSVEKNSIRFHCFYAAYDNLYSVDKSVRVQIRKIIDEVRPDIIHIFGTEMPHAVACVDCVKDRSKVVISIQGLVSECARYYLNGIPSRAYLYGGFYNGRYQTILSQYREFCKRTDNELRALKGVRHVIGRTDWDRACVSRINERCEYHYCSETLRECFYGSEREPDKVKRHTIFVSQGDYPIKGLHNLVVALPMIIRKYPDTKVYVAGSKAFLEDGSPYGIYMHKLIQKKGVGPYISFLGMLDGERVRRQLMKAHMALMTSNIENSPNSIGEAMLIGTPVAAAFVGGIPSILQHRREGLLYQADSAVMLADAVFQIFGDDDLAMKLSLNAKRRAEKLYDQAANLKQLLKIYDCI